MLPRQCLVVKHTNSDFANFDFATSADFATMPTKLLKSKQDVCKAVKTPKESFITRNYL